ncbi:MAG: DUF975 family protein [Oscillospiraceae bacterium]|nr:DUF975 family protein [Oscillospiraceae bacterium]
MLDRIALKAEAKSIVKSAAVSAYVFTLIYLAFLFVLDLILEFATGATAADLSMVLEMEIPFPTLGLSPLMVTFISILVSLISMVLSTGYLIYHLGIRKNHTMPYATLFDGFAFVGKIIVLQIMIAVFTFLWSLLLFFPGIIAAYRYRYALYNLCDNPQLSPSEALNMSKAQTRGYKWQLFVLDLSFLGWNILCALTLGILSIWIAPYIQQTDVGFFEEIKRRSGIGYLPMEDGQFHRDDRFEQNSDTEPHAYDPER